MAEVDRRQAAAYTLAMPAWRSPEFWVIIAAVAVLTAGHYVTSTHDPFWHDLFRRLYYLPIVLAGFRYGLKGGLATAGAVSLVFLPHVLATHETLHVQASEARFEIPLYLAVGAITGILADRQRRAESAMRRTERLKTLGEMAAGVAHEVKNPLAAIRSSAELLKSRVSGRETELAGIVVAEVDRLNRVVTDLLLYARPAPLKRERIRLSQVLDSCAAFLAPVAGEKQVVFEKSYPGAEPAVNADPDRVRQVLLNVMLNAVEASPEGAAVRMNVSRAGRHVTVTVSDAGPGMSQDQLERAGEPFFTTKRGGTGLGLAIARRVVAEHGGRLTIESSSGRETTVSVTLPVR